MKKIICVFLLFAAFSLAKAQTNAWMKYTRSSLYPLLLEHSELRYADEIREVYNKCAIPDKFNDHRLSVRSIRTPQADDMVKLLERFIKREQLAKRLVSKWYMRDKETGRFSMDTIWARGMYNATGIDISLSREQVRKSASLMDAGVQMIGSTFLVAHDIRYVDKSDKAFAFGNWMRIAAMVGETVAQGISEGSQGQAAKAEAWATLASDVANLSAAVADEIKGFKVVISSYLFRLDWGVPQMEKLDAEYYTDVPDFDKKVAYENDSVTFRMKYVGKTEVKSGNITLKGTVTNEDMIRKVLIRATDKALVELQRAYDEFKIKSPVIQVEGKKLYAAIGVKEGVLKEAKYEVLRLELKENQLRYNRIGVVRPSSDKEIWDNTYLSEADGSKTACLGRTAFEKVSGGDFMEGMLLREIK